nr:uncharacterized protein LOC109193611 [Ipomoea batatas]
MESVEELPPDVLAHGVAFAAGSHFRHSHEPPPSSKVVTWCLLAVEELLPCCCVEGENDGRRGALPIKELCFDSSDISLPWVAVRDFNSVASRDEVSCLEGFQEQQSREFLEWIDNENLIDLGFLGPKFTWKRGANSESFRYVRLFRALCSERWLDMLPTAGVTNLPSATSNHNPILVETRGRDFNYAPRRTSFGNIDKRKRRVLAHLEGIQKRIGTSLNDNMIKLERKLKKELEDILYQEEHTWYQRSQEDWIVPRDRNIKFYHAVTKLRKATSGLMVYALMNEMSTKEVRDAMFSIAPYKAPGSDGFHAGFYKNAWVAAMAFSPPGVSLFDGKLQTRAGVIGGGLAAATISGQPWESSAIDEVAERIIATAGVGKVEDLGRYLGIPSIHGCVTHRLFGPNMERFDERFEGCKGKHLTLARRRSLAQSMLNACPYYIMQTMLVPKEESSGRFSVASDYNLALGKMRNGAREDWDDIWRIKVPNNFCYFLWLVKHERIMTNVERRKSALTIDVRCSSCNEDEENVDHLLRKCDKAKVIWKAILPSWETRKLEALDFKNWMRTNVNGKVKTDYGKNWNVMFALAVWWIWH